MTVLPWRGAAAANSGATQKLTVPLPGSAVDALERLNLTEEEKRKIRWENANRLFSLKRTDSTKPAR